MDDFDSLLTGIIGKVEGSELSDQEKADVYASLQAGLHHLVWPIILSHVPKYLLEDFVKNPNGATLDTYTELIESSLSNPATPKDVHDEVIEALREVDAAVSKSLPKHALS